MFMEPMKSLGPKVPLLGGMEGPQEEARRRIYPGVEDAWTTEALGGMLAPRPRGQTPEPLHIPELWFPPVEDGVGVASSHAGDDGLLGGAGASCPAGQLVYSKPRLCP